MGVDAVTVSPYLGYDSIEPFLKYEERAVFILCRTSNPGARDFQDLVVIDGGIRKAHLYELVAQRAMEWNRAGNVGLVVGATYVDELEAVRRICPTLPILIPGVGAQGGDLCGAVEKGVDANGRSAIVNASREVLYASCEPATFAAAARTAAAKLRDVMNDTLAAIGRAGEITPLCTPHECVEAFAGGAAADNAGGHVRVLRVGARGSRGASWSSTQSLV